MERLDTYRVDLKGMKTDSGAMQWTVDNAFFDAVEATEVHTGHVWVELDVKRNHNETYELTFHINGTIQVPCDRCLEPVELVIDTCQALKVRTGEAYEDDGQWVTIPEVDGTINVAWNIYEFIALEIPIRHVHADGQCPGQADSLLGKGETEMADPRWDKLKTILNNKRQ